MKILVLSLLDSGGSCGKFARAIAEYPKHQVEAARWHKGKVVSYAVSDKYCIWQPDEARTLELIEWCQAIVVTGPWRGLPRRQLPWGTNCLIPPGAPRRPMVINYQGSLYRRRQADHDQHDRQAKALQTGILLDLLALGNIKHWLPVPVWAGELRKVRRPNYHESFHVVQAVTQAKRFHLKSVPGVKKRLTDLDGVSLDIIHNLPHKECLKRMGRADLVVTAFKNSFGNTGLEAMAMGIPIVANGFDDYIAEVEKQVGYLPFYQSKVSELRQTVTSFRDDPELCEKWSIIGSEYIERFHSPKSVAEKAIELCQMAKPARY